MNCNDCVERLYAFLDLELDEKELAQVRAHVAGCDDCGDQLGLEARFLDRLRDCCTSDAAPRARHPEDPRRESAGELRPLMC